MGNTFDAIIIGAGIVGCSISHALSRNGLKTLNVDPLPAAGYGSTSHSSAIVRPFYSHAQACALAHEARGRWLNWQEFLECHDERGFAHYNECGMITLLTEGQENQFEATCAAMKEAGVDFAMLQEADLKKRLPNMSYQSFGPPTRITEAGFGEANGGKIIGGIYVPAAGFVNDPQLATHNLQMAAIEEGAQFLFGVTVESILKERDRVSGVTLSSNAEISAPIVINAAGPHSHVINELAGVVGTMQVSTQAMRHEVVYLSSPPDFGTEDARSVIMDSDSGVYMRPDGADILIGSLDPECDAQDWADPNDYNDTFTEQWTNQAWRAGQRLPQLEISNQARGTVGLYDVSDDWIPIYDKSDLAGFYMAIGTSGNQFKNAPMIGDLMAEIIMACEGGKDHDQIPATLLLPEAGLEIDLFYYSRNRTIQETNNVLA